MGKRGPKPTWAEDHRREPVVGLILRADGRYAAHENRNKTFGRDRDSAIRKFRAWQARELKESVILECDGGDLIPELVEPVAVRDIIEDRQFIRYDLPSNAFWDKMRQVLHENPKLAAEKTGIEELAYLHDLKPPAPSIPLDDLLDLYLTKQLSADWKRQARLFWKELKTIAKVKTAREITAEHIEAYHDKMFDKMERGKHSPTYVKHRFGMIKSIFSFGLKRGRDQAEMRRVLDLCKMLVPPRANGKNPQPISRDHFHKLLAVSDVKWTAVYLLSLNAALYPSEVAAVRKDEIDLDAKTLRMDRGKTGIHRIAVLWDRTIDAIRKYQQEQPHDHENLFVSELGQCYNANHMGRNFRRRRAEAGMPETIQFAHIRDGAETAAIEGGADLTQAKLLAGHRVGISDHYVRRNPKMVADACEAIERHYWGGNGDEA